MGKLRSLAMWLTEPSPRIQDPIEAGSARVLAACALLTLVGFIALDAHLLTSREEYRPPYAGYLFLVLGNVLSRTRHFKWGAAVFTAMFALIPIAIVLSDGGRSESLVFSCIAPVFAGIFLGLRAVFTVGIANAAILACVPLLSAGRYTFAETAIPMTAAFVTATVAAVHVAHRDWVERSRREEMALREAQVRHLQKMEAIGRFAGGIAHDFNNVLAIIGAGVESMRRRQGSRELELVDSAVGSARDLTQQLLTMSRHGEVAHDGVVEVAATFEKVGAMLERIIGKDIAVSMDVDPDVEEAAVTPGRLELLNMATNARDAMPKGGSLAFRAEPAEGGVEITVRDTGSGMDEATMQRIFEPFYTTKAEGKGTGLGLAVVFGIIAQAGGKVSVESTIGAGTTFHIWLPRARSSQTHRRASNS